MTWIFRLVKQLLMKEKGKETDYHNTKAISGPASEEEEHQVQIAQHHFFQDPT